MKFLMVLAIFFTIQVRAEFVTNYSFPLLDSLKGTVAAGAISASTTAVSSKFKVKILDRKKNSARKDLEVRFFPVANSNQLVLILPGLGGTINSPMAQFLAANFQSLGFASLILPNAMTKEFVLGASSQGLVGDTELDAQDMHQALQASIASLSSQGLHFSQIQLIGYSHGALLAARVAELESKNEKLNLQSTLLLNPPVNLLQGMRTLDAYYAKYHSMGLGSLLNLQKLVKQFLSLLGLPEKANAVPMSERDMQGAIGYSMREGFDKMILATQEINDQELLSEYEDERLSEAKDIGFEQYVTEFFSDAFKRKGQKFDLEAMNARVSLSAQESFLSLAKNVFVLHNANDFLLSAEDGKWLETTFQARARIYPTGGHLGNLSNLDNMNAIKSWLQGLEIN